MDKYFDLNVSVPVLLTRLGCAVVLGAILAFRPLAKRPVKVEIAHSLLIMTVAAAMVVVVIGDSLARAFGVVGLGSFIRFRSSIKDPRDVTLFFLAIGTGMACGLGAVPVAGVGVGVLWSLLVVLDRIPAPPTPPEPARSAPPSEPWVSPAPQPLELQR